MSLTITHAKVTTGTVDNSVEVDLQDWNDNHTIAGSIAASEVTSGAELSKTDDTNVTLTLGGTPSTALLKATSLALGWAGTLSPARGGTGVANNAASTIAISGAFASTFTMTGTTGVTFPTTGTLATLAGAETLSNKILNLSSNTFNGNTAAFNLALNDGDFATLAGTEALTNKTYSGTSVTSPIVKSDAALDFQTNGTTVAGNVTAGQQWLISGTVNTPPTGPLLTVTKSTGALPAIGTPQGITGTAQLGAIFGGPDSGANDIIVQAAGTCGVRYLNSAGTLASRSATSNGSSMAVNFSYGFDGTNYQVGCGFVMTATQLWAVGSSGSRLDLYGIANSSASLTLAASVQTGFMVGDQTDPGVGAISATTSIKSKGATSGIGYMTGAGGAVTQATSRTTGVTLNKVSGAITLVSAAGSASFQSFTVTNSAVAATDIIHVNQKSGTDLNEIHVTAIAAGSFQITFRTTGGTTVEQPVFNFAVIKAVAA